MPSLDVGQFKGRHCQRCAHRPLPPVPKAPCGIFYQRIDQYGFHPIAASLICLVHSAAARGLSQFDPIGRAIATPITIRSTSGFSRSNESRNASKATVSTPYLPTRCRLRMSTWSRVRRFPFSPINSKPRRAPLLRILAVKKPAMLTDSIRPMMFRISVVLPTPGFPVINVLACLNRIVG